MIELPRQIYQAVLAHAEYCAPLEACGLLALDGSGAVRMAYCLTNADASRTRFTVAPHEHVGALRHAERQGWTLGGVFHSHPCAAAYPSAADVAGALEPEWLHLIVGPLDRPALRAFRIVPPRVTEVAFELV